MTRRSDRALVAASLLLLIAVTLAGLFAHRLARRPEPPVEALSSSPWGHVCPTPLHAGWNVLCGCGPYASRDQREFWRSHGW